MRLWQGRQHVEVEEDSTVGMAVSGGAVCVAADIAGVTGVTAVAPCLEEFVGVRRVFLAAFALFSFCLFRPRGVVVVKAASSLDALEVEDSKSISTF